MEDILRKKKKAQDKCDSVCVSYIKNWISSGINIYSGVDNDDDETKYGDVVYSESYAKGEISSDSIQQMVWSVKILD